MFHKTMIVGFVLFGGPAFAAPSPDAGAEGANTETTPAKYALVIGINEYASADIEELSTAVNDATEVGNILDQFYGYEVSTFSNEQATKRNIYMELARLRSVAKDEDSVLIYFAGHGEVDELGAYWLPTDAEVPGTPGSEASWIPSSLIRDNLAAFKNRHVLIVSDSCFAGGLISTRSASSSAQSQPNWVEKVGQKKSRWIFASGSNEPVADANEVSADHSVFAFFFIDALRDLSEKPYTIQDLVSTVQRNVGNNSWQTPRANAIIGAGDMGGQMVFESNVLVIPEGKDQFTAAPGAMDMFPSRSAESMRIKRIMLIGGISGIAASVSSLAIAGWAKQQYLASDNDADRDRYQKMNATFGYAGIGIGVAGGAATIGAVVSGEF